MKNKFLLTIAIAAGALTSCNMDLDPVGAILDSESVTSITDAQGFRNAFYGNFRSFTSSGYVAYPDLQCDQFNGLIVNGNNYGIIANGTILSNNSDIEGVWAGMFSRINNINFFMQEAQPLYQKYLEGNDQENLEEMDHIFAEARFMRAYYYACMFDRFCQVYSPEKGDIEGLGCAIDTIYDPSPNRASYVGRSTMNKTIKFVDEEFEKALKGLEAYEVVMKEAYSQTSDNYTLKPGAIYLSSYVVKHMMARWNFLLGRYDKAIAYAKDVIDSKLYPLCTLDAYAAMWTNDTGSELLFVPYEDTNELGGAIGACYLDNISGAWYIPNSQVIDQLHAAGTVLRKPADIRCTTFIGDRQVKSAFGTITVTGFTKFPGNPSLQTTAQNNFCNKPKPFRTSELYLIIAEAAAMQGDATTANEYLNALLKVRIRSYKDKNLSGSELLNEVRNQRSLELIGEGFRMSDLRRWGRGFNRASAVSYENTQVNQLLVAVGLTVVYEPNDHRYTWPIPSNELTTNPQMAGQQNPGY